MHPMNLMRDLRDVSEGKTPTSILALVQMGYATFPPPQLTEHGAALLRELTHEEGAIPPFTPDGEL